VLRYIVHTLVGGGGQHGGFDALDYRKIKHGDGGKLGKSDIRCPTNLQGFCMNFMFSCPLASICHPYQLIEATLMYMVQSITIRYESCCICSPVSTILVIVNLMIIGFVRIIGSKTENI
jgi:hypothetical protein